MKFYEGVAQLSSRVSSASPFRLCWSSGACRSAVHPAMRGVDLRARTVARNWKESRPRRARPEDSSIIYIWLRAVCFCTQFGPNPGVASETVMVTGGPGRHQDGMPTVPQWRRGWPNTCRTISPICRDAATSRTNKLPARPEKCGARPA